ncbi:excisionase [Escherichia coli]
MFGLISARTFTPLPIVCCGIPIKVDLNRPVTGSLLKRIRNGKKAKS